MWKPEHRAAADRGGLRYPSDMTDAEWALVAPLIRPAKRGGRPRTVDVREVLNAIFYVLWTGCQWKAGKNISHHYPIFLSPLPRVEAGYRCPTQTERQGYMLRPGSGPRIH